MKLFFLASGRGSNFNAVCEAYAQGRLNRCQFAGLFSSHEDAPVLALAKKHGVTAFCIDRKKFQKENPGLDSEAFRKIYDKKILEIVKRSGADWICLAGYRFLLGKEMVQTYANRIINIHPSLLPDFKGLDAQAQALKAGVKQSGCTVHLVNEHLDDGPILAQSVVPVFKGDTEESLSERILLAEHPTLVNALIKLSLEN